MKNQSDVNKEEHLNDENSFGDESLDKDKNTQVLKKLSMEILNRMHTLSLNSEV